MFFKKIERDCLKELYKEIYSSEMPKWATLNAPYFNEYKLISYDQFLISNHIPFLMSDDVLGIFVDGKIKGIITRYWENRETRWLEIGIVIYDENYWNKGLGYNALNFWIDKCFKDFPEIERVGLTTWSGNLGMINLSFKLNMKEEGRIRKVRYYNGTYYDSLKYGILREEFYKK